MSNVLIWHWFIQTCDCRTSLKNVTFFTWCIIKYFVNWKINQTFLCSKLFSYQFWYTQKCEMLIKMKKMALPLKTNSSRDISWSFFFKYKASKEAQISRKRWAFPLLAKLDNRTFHSVFHSACVLQPDLPHAFFTIAAT